MHKTPVDLYDGGSIYTDFYGVNKTKCTLYVPTGSKALYQAATQWKDFTNIVELDSVVSKTLTLSGGDLAGQLSSTDRITTTKLIIKGSVNAKDIAFMRDSLPFLEDVDFSSATIIEDNNSSSTLFRSATFTANTIPARAFFGKTMLRQITLPASLTAIGDSAFWGCTQLRIIGLNSTPIDLSASVNVFEYIPRDKCTLEVPAGSLASYRSAQVWSEFVTIEESTTTALNTTETPKLTVIKNGDQVLIKGIQLGEDYNIVNVLGQTVVSGTAKSDMINVSLPTGIYVVKTNTQSVKFVY
jgi:hypothetical protein